jgi:hypothetical protein
MRAGLSFSYPPISLLLRQPLSIKKSYAGAIQVLCSDEIVQTKKCCAGQSDKDWSDLGDCGHRVHTRVAMAAFWRIHVNRMEKYAKSGEGAGGGVHAHPFHYIYHHIQSCGVRSS